MGLQVICVGHTSATDDAGIIGVRLDPLRWVRPTGRPPTQPRPEAGDPGAPVLTAATLLPPPLMSVPVLTPRIPRVAPLASTLRVLDVVDLGDCDEAWPSDRPEVVHADLMSWTKVSAADRPDAGELVSRAIAATDTGAALRIVAAQDLAFVVLGRDVATRTVSALFLLDDRIVEGPVFDRGFLAALSPSAGRGQHHPAGLGVAEPVHLVVGTDEPGGRAGVAVLGIIGGLSS